MADALRPRRATPAPQVFSIKCGRCGVVFPTQECGKLDHFSIYRVVCPHCDWPGRYLASELHAASDPRPAPATSGGKGGVNRRPR